MTVRVPHLINGEWRHDAGSAPFAVTDPTSNQPLWQVASASLLLKFFVGGIFVF